MATTRSSRRTSDGTTAITASTTNVTGGRIIGNTVYYNCTDGINVEGTSGNYNIENNVR